MRDCPVCEEEERDLIFSMDYRIPDGWPLPKKINWYKCSKCDMIYGDGRFNQNMLNEYYTKYYGYGINNLSNVKRLQQDAVNISLLGNVN